jgi:hypothetical protein
VVGNGTVSFREPTDSWNQSEPRSAPPRSGKGRPSSVNVAVSSCERTCHAKFAVGPTVTARANNARARAGAGAGCSAYVRRKTSYAPCGTVTVNTDGVAEVAPP